MYLIEGKPRGEAELTAIRSAAPERRKLPDETRFRIKTLFNRQFERLTYEGPQQLREELLGTAVAMGLDKDKGLAKIQLAADLAEAIHEPQKRKFTGQPYVVHPYRSAFLAMELSAAMNVPVTTELIVGALLHDAVEDHPEFVTKAFLRERFAEFDHDGKYGKHVAADSYALSRNENGIPIPDTKYLARIRETNDRETLMRRYIIKTADRIDNLLDPPKSPDDTTETGKKIRKKRRRIIDKTENDVLTLLLDQPEGIEVPTDLLTRVLLTAVELSEATLSNAEFYPHAWEEYLQEAV